jgi:hypothetical protein
MIVADYSTVPPVCAAFSSTNTCNVGDTSSLNIDAYMGIDTYYTSTLSAVNIPAGSLGGVPNADLVIFVTIESTSIYCSAGAECK